MNGRLEKILIIGPTYPYKGGIAHYTGLMAKTFLKKYSVDVFSFSYQYPKLLYKKPQKDFKNDAFKVENVNFCLHTANPANWWKTANAVNTIKPDLVIFQWWHPYFVPCYNSIIQRLKNTKVLFICHNVFPHERFLFDHFLTKLVLRKGDYFITHSKQDTDDLLSIYPGACYKKVVHPAYNDFKIQDMDMGSARKQLKIPDNKRVLLFFGFVRRYKGLHHLLDAMPDVIKKYPEALLLIVGDFGKDKPEYLSQIEKLSLADNIELHDGYTPDNEVEKFFAASDLVVLPYESATQSGIVQIAYSFEKPVIATDVGGLPEVVLNEKTGYIVPPFDAQELASAIIRFFEEGKGELFSKNVKEEAYKYEWERMREAIEALVIGREEDPE